MQLAPAAPLSVPAPSPAPRSASASAAAGPSISLTFSASNGVSNNPGRLAQTAQAAPSTRSTRMSVKPKTPRATSDLSPATMKRRTSPSEIKRSKPTFTSSLSYPELGQLPPPPITSSADEGSDLLRSQRRSKVEAITKIDRGGTPGQIASSGTAGTSFLPPSAQPQPTAGPSAARNPLNRAPNINPPFSLDTVRTKAPRDPPSRSHSRLFGLTECPAYYPTEDQFRDPMTYIASITDEARKYGICKIIPPEGWQMPFSLDTETFKFRTRLQRLNQLEAASRAKVNFLEQLSMFHMQQGDNEATIPVIDRQQLDVWRLRKEVNKAGGHLELNRTQGWPAITELLGYKPAWWTHIKDAYMRIVLPFDKWATRAKSASNSPFTPIAKTQSGQPPAFAMETPPSPSAAARMSGMRASPRTRMGANLALSAKMSSLNSPLNTTATAISRSDSDHHPYEAEITRSASAAPALPTLKIKVPGFSSRDGSESDLSEDSALSEESPRKKRQPTPEYQKGEVCEVCRGGHAADKILLCDGCDRGFHTYCLDPPLAAVPTNEEWFCTSCLLSQGDDFGFAEGEDHSVASFQARDAAFSHAWWNRHRPPLSPGATMNANPNPDPLGRHFGRVPVTEDDVEREFWRLTESSTDTVEIEYGADVHSTTHGSAGPTMETHPLDAYASSPWNLNNMPILPDSLLRYIRSDISGMTVPWIYLGMMFSTFCWHNEDHYTYSVNYMYWGETKTWYGIPGDDADKFEAAMKSEAPELFEQQPGLLFQLVTMMNPGRVKDAGVDVFACDQRPNEFVITFPKAYHCGFNHGINMNEAVNFALPDWLAAGKQSVVRYKEYLKPPVFSHNELLITITLYSETIRTALWLKDSLAEMVEVETIRREKLRSACPVLTESINEDDVPEEQYQCAVCKGFCYLSQITCPCTKLVSCLEHADQLCSCAMAKKTLRKRYSEAQLEEILALVLARAAQPENWRNRFYALLEVPRPALKSMRALLTDGEKIAYPMRETGGLRMLVDRANAWVERVLAVLTRKSAGRRRKGAKDKDEDDDMVDRSPEALRDLLREAERMAFDTPEIPQLRQALLSIESFRSEASVIFSTPENELDLERCKTVLILGESLNLDMPEIAAIQMIINRLGWFQQVEEEVDDRTLQYDDVLGLLAKADEYQVPYDHPTIVELEKRRQTGADWLAAAKKTLAASSIDLDDISTLIEGQDLVPISMDVMRQLESIRKTALNWQTSAKNLLASNGSALAASRLCKSVASASTPLNRVHIPEIAALQVELDHHAQWNEQMSQLLEVPPNKVANQIITINREFAATLSEEDEEPNEDHTCYCRSPPGATMVTCRGCRGVYHPKCVGVNPRNAALSFQCEICDRLLPPIWPSLDRFMALAQPRRWNFIIKPSEFIAAQDIADMGIRAAKAIIRLCDPDDVAVPQTDVEKLQHWIRKIYQLPLTFEVENVARKERVVLVTQLFHRLQQGTKMSLGLVNGYGKEKPAATRTRGRKARFVLAQSYPREFHCICRTPPAEDSKPVTCFKCGQGYHSSCVKVPLEAGETESTKPWRCPCCAVKEAKYYQKNLEVRVQLQDQLGSNEYVDYRSTIMDYAINPVRFTIAPETDTSGHIVLECTQFIPPVPPEELGNTQTRENEGASAAADGRTVNGIDNNIEPSRKRRKVGSSEAGPAEVNTMGVTTNGDRNGSNHHVSKTDGLNSTAPLKIDGQVNGNVHGSHPYPSPISMTTAGTSGSTSNGIPPRNLYQQPRTIFDQHAGLSSVSQHPFASQQQPPRAIFNAPAPPEYSGGQNVEIPQPSSESETHGDSRPSPVQATASAAFSHASTPLAPPPHVLPESLNIASGAKHQREEASQSPSPFGPPKHSPTHIPVAAQAASPLTTSRSDASVPPPTSSPIVQGHTPAAISPTQPFSEQPSSSTTFVNNAQASPARNIDASAGAAVDPGTLDFTTSDSARPRSKSRSRKSGSAGSAADDPIDVEEVYRNRIGSPEKPIVILD